MKKCPYCDFNSHEAQQIPEQDYVKALLIDLSNTQPYIQNRSLRSIFFGGGTPSLFSAKAIGDILEGIAKQINFSTDIEITLEANPDSVESLKFQELVSAGINRASLGVQSFDNEKLQSLGRAHDAEIAISAIKIAQKCGLKSFNIDLMYGLPQQSCKQALQDLKLAQSFSPAHISWYQLTIEKNTVFFNTPPTLPKDIVMENMFDEGLAYLATQGYQQYEVSAHASPGWESAHNLNYWEFGDYLGIGAGAHAKYTDLSSNKIVREWKTRAPDHYLNSDKKFLAGQQILSEKNLIAEFMLNTLRLKQGIPKSYFTMRTGLSIKHIESTLNHLEKDGLMEVSKTHYRTTELGYRHLNSVLNPFLD